MYIWRVCVLGDVHFDLANNAHKGLSIYYIYNIINISGDCPGLEMSCTSASSPVAGAVKPTKKITVGVKPTQRAGEQGMFIALLV